MCCPVAIKLYNKYVGGVDSPDAKHKYSSATCIHVADDPRSGGIDSFILYLTYV